LRERGHFLQPHSSEELIEMMDDAASPLRRFLKEECELGEGYDEDCDRNLYTAYKLWCTENEHHPMSKTRFHDALISAEPAINVRRLGERGRQRWTAQGVRLKGSEKPDMPLAA
jgi:phage/plasmid-associated DNA primase